MPWDVENLKFVRFEDVQLEDDDLETLFVAGVRCAYLSNTVVDRQYALILYLHRLSIQSS